MTGVARRPVISSVALTPRSAGNCVCSLAICAGRARAENSDKEPPPHHATGGYGIWLPAKDRDPVIRQTLSDRSHIAIPVGQLSYRRRPRLTSRFIRRLRLVRVRDQSSVIPDVPWS